MGELPADARLGAIRLRVGNLERLHDFYERTIGLRTIGVDGDVASVERTVRRWWSSLPIPTRRSGLRARRACSTWQSSSPPVRTSRARFAVWSSPAGV